jgi:hypothetical protein
LLCAKAKRVHQEVLGLPLPPDIRALFDLPDVRTIRFPQFREGRGRSIPGSTSLPPRKLDFKLPTVSTFPGFHVGLTDARPILVHPPGSQRRKRFSLIA